MSETNPAKEGLQVGEKIYGAGATFQELQVSGFLNDSVPLEDGRTLYRTRMALNSITEKGTKKFFELELLNTRSANSNFSKEMIWELAQEREYWESLNLFQQEQAERAYLEASGDMEKINPKAVSGEYVTLLGRYLGNKENQRVFYKAKAAAQVVQQKK